MNSCLSPCDKEEIRAKAMSLGACRCGFAAAGPVAATAAHRYRQWIADGCHYTMDYCARYMDVREDPRLLLDGCAAVVSTAWAYPRRGDGLIASYALVKDYHYVLKERMSQLGQWMVERWGGECRTVVDTAPMRERYWAQQAGVGYVGVNNMLIVPGIGSYVFLAELLWTQPVPPDAPCTLSCDGCMRCVKACPGHAIQADRGVDARRCHSCLTIEHRGKLAEDVALSTIYGCDACQRVCPHNSEASAVQSIFEPDAAIAELTPENIMQMSASHYKRVVAHSAMRRAPLAQLRRNLSNLKTNKP